MSRVVRRFMVREVGSGSGSLKGQGEGEGIGEVVDRASTTEGEPIEVPMILLTIAGLLFGGGQALAHSEADVPAAVLQKVDELSTAEQNTREIWLASSRANAARRYVEAEVAVSEASPEDRACRQERLDQVRALMARIDELGAVVIPDRTSIPVRRAGLLAIASAQHPVLQVDAAAPCSASTEASERTWRGPEAKPLPPIVEDDPLTLGFEQPGRRALKPR